MTTPRRSPARADAPARAPVPFVGLTGGIGAGKSTALAALGRLGAATLSTDAVVHELYDSAEVRDLVVERWGDEVAPGGRIDRRAVAERAFATPADRAWLEELLWPRVGARIVAWREDLARAEAPPVAAVVEVPLLFEAGMQGAYDATLAITAEESLRAERAGGRGHAAVDERTARQLGQGEKAERATFAVANDGTERDLEARLAEILVKLRE